MIGSGYVLAMYEETLPYKSYTMTHRWGGEPAACWLIRGESVASLCFWLGREGDADGPAS